MNHIISGRPIFSFFCSLLITLIFSSATSFSQTFSRDYRVMFYNVENLFDTIDDPLKNDAEFTPEGIKSWGSARYHNKLVEIYKVIMAIGQWNLPIVVGLAEVENERVLNDLICQTPLNKFNYEFILEESNDHRGIDVGLIYRSDLLTYVNHKAIQLEGLGATRDILLFTGIISDDTLHFLINHWPSRIGGKEHSEQRRLKASDELTQAVDSLFSSYVDPKIIVMGDFNDTPDDKSIKQFLNKTYPDKHQKVYKFKLPMPSGDQAGTIVYTDVFSNWYLFDQILLTETLTHSEMQIFKGPWLLNYLGRPDRTYLGDYYNGGVSDHLPVFLDFSIGN